MNEIPAIPEPPNPNDRRQRLLERFKFRRVNEITGTFVLVIVAVLVAAIIWMGHSQRWFKSRVPLRIVLPEAGAAGICQGSEVYFLGTLVGSVSDVEVDAQGRMQAQANIRRDFFRFVRADSSAVIKKKFGVAGDSFFEVSRGEGKPLPEQDASIVCNEQFQSAIESAIEDIRREALLALKKTSVGLDTWTQLGANLDETRKHLDEITAHLENLASGIEAGKGTVGKLITDPALADEAQKLLTQANETMAVFQGVVTNLDVTAMNVRKGTMRLPEINDSVADTTKNLPELVRQMQVSTREMERLTEAMERHWFIRKYVNQTNPPPSPPPPAKFIGPVR
ncbi:MAG TPA: MlaD family protein [Candidatus Acidoferrales bacterium]|jgi:phospholipid/cholesterol/gamma-HCH transport system substrate-binding protein|nr:MlaD family protein [Candidatus Acidoferrales bacterium]